jgi:hypothetical protein
MKTRFSIPIMLATIASLAIVGGCAAGATITLGGSTVTATIPPFTVILPGGVTSTVTMTLPAQAPPTITVTLSPGLPTLPVTAPPATSYPPFTPGYYGPGGMMGPGGGMGPDMMGGWYQYPGSRIGADAATKVVQDYLATANNPNLVIGEEMEFQYNYYFEIKEKDTGTGAFELLVDPYNGALYPEPGPNMMWNTKYGMMMGTSFGLPNPTTPLTISEAQAKQRAQDFLNTYAPGSTVGDINRFYGYYTIDAEKDGRAFGMLSVSGYTGQVWYHTWHGQFIAEKEF